MPATHVFGDTAFTFSVTPHFVAVASIVVSAPLLATPFDLVLSRVLS
jgi:hypothetical protein